MKKEKTPLADLQKSPEENIDSAKTALSSIEDNFGKTQSSENNNSDEFKDEEFKKWKGKYFTSFIEAQGEGAYNAIIEINIEAPDEAHFQLYYQELNETEKTIGTKIYGGFKRFDKTNNAIEFQPEVIYEGQDSGLDKNFILYEDHGKYFIKTEMVVPENVPKDLIPIRKLDN